MNYSTEPEMSDTIQLAFTEWSYYQAGMLDIYYQLYDADVFTFEHIADAMHLDKTLIAEAYPVWKNGKIAQRGGLMQEILLQQVDLDEWKYRAAYSAALLLDILNEDKRRKKDEN